MVLGLVFVGLGIANLGGHDNKHEAKTETAAHGEHGVAAHKLKDIMQPLMKNMETFQMRPSVLVWSFIL